LEPENQQPEPGRSSPEIEQDAIPADQHEPARTDNGLTDAARTADSGVASVPLEGRPPVAEPLAPSAERDASDRERQRLEEWEDRLVTTEADLTARQIELAARQEEVEAERKRLADWNDEIQEREAFLRAGRKQFQDTLDEFHAEQRRFRTAVGSVKAQRARARRRREQTALAAQDQIFAQVLSSRGILNEPQANWFAQGRFRDFVIGNYRILNFLSLGSSEWIYEARDANDGTRVAMKALRSDRVGDPAAAERLQREARVGTDVDHANVVRTRSFGRADDGTAYLVMDLVEGVTLGELIALHGKLPWHEACNYIFQASIGLKRLHQSGILHRDVHPWNLLIDRNGALKVADFGHASAPFLDNPAGDRQAMLPVSSRGLDYAAPEMFNPAQRVSPQADIYSLGCIFYHALTGSVPFPDLDAAGKINAHRSQPPATIRSRVARVPSEVVTLVRKMMAKETIFRLPFMPDVTRALATLATPRWPYFDERLISVERAFAARARLRDEARQIVERQKSNEPAVPQASPGGSPPAT
jgi:eukaryotic-like serine/threonine-protein kinase